MPMEEGVDKRVHAHVKGKTSEETEAFSFSCLLAPVVACHQAPMRCMKSRRAYCTVQRRRSPFYPRTQSRKRLRLHKLEARRNAQHSSPQEAGETGNRTARNLCPRAWHFQEHPGTHRRHGRDHYSHLEQSRRHLWALHPEQVVPSISGRSKDSLQAARAEAGQPAEGDKTATHQKCRGRHWARLACKNLCRQASLYPASPSASA